MNIHKYNKINKLWDVMYSMAIIINNTMLNIYIFEQYNYIYLKVAGRVEFTIYLFTFLEREGERVE